MVATLEEFVTRVIVGNEIFGEYALHDDSLKSARDDARDAYLNSLNAIISIITTEPKDTGLFGRIIAVTSQFLDAEAPWSSPTLFQQALSTLDALTSHTQCSLASLSTECLTGALEQLRTMQTAECPAVATAVYWTVCRVRHPGLDGAVSGVMPLLLRVFDQASSRGRIPVIRAMQHVVREAPATEVRWFGGPLMETLLSAVRVGEPGDAALASMAAAECCAETAAVLDRSADGANHVAALERAIELLPLSYSEMQRTMCRLISALAKRMRIACVPYLKRLFPLLAAVAESPSRGPEAIAALEAMLTLVTYCRVRIHAHARSLTRVLDGIQSAGTQDEVAQQAQLIREQVNHIVS